MSDEMSSGANVPGSAPQQAHLHPDPAAIKLTRGTSCVLCQQRKVRCDKNKPCANCVKAKVECRVIPPQPPRRRKKRLQEKDLIDRLKRYESLLSEHGVKFDAIGHHLRSDNQQGDDVDELENDFEGLKTSPEASVSPPGPSQSDRPGDSLSFSLHKEFRASEQLLRDSSEDEDAPGVSNIHRAFDKMFSNDGFPFVIGGQAGPVTDLHPPPVQIFQLWQIYIDNINKLLKITHVPTIQSQIIEASSQLDKVPKNIEALMFSIYLMAITSLEDIDVRNRFAEPRQVLLARYHGGLQQALINADFMRVSDPIVLQAFVLYLFAVRWFVDPRQVFCLIGIAVRIAQRMGLHRDPGQYGLPPFEVEQRRRLWWTIVGYDRRIGEMTGSTVTALSTGGDTKIPLNVNDSDLHIDGKESPTPHTGPTEMLFALTRTELAMAVASDSNRDSHKLSNSDKSPPAASYSQPGPTIRLVGQDSPAYTLDGYCAHVEGTYLSHCDPKIPFHFFTLTMTRQALCKMRVINFLVRMHDAEHMPLKEVERDSLFLQAIQMIEYDNVVQSSESLRPYKWYSMHHFPFPAYMFLVQELRSRITGPMVERAWEAIALNHDLRGLLNNYHSPMHMVFGNHFIKAWDTHEAAQRSAGKQVIRPSFLGILRDRAEQRRRARAENRPDPALSQPQIGVPRAMGTPGTAQSGSPAMMTPPVDASNGGSQAGAPSSSASGEDPGEGMDWSYLISGYDTSAGFPTMAGFGGGGFGPTMGGGMSSGGMPGMPGMGGMGGGPRGNMFGGN